MGDVLVCSALDPSGGTGFIADARVIAELGARPCGVVTALVVQNTGGIAGFHPCDPEVLGHQLEFLLTDVEVKAVKIGTVGSVEVARAIGKALELSAAQVVWDLGMYPSEVQQRLNEETLFEIMDALQPHLTLVTVLSEAFGTELSKRLGSVKVYAAMRPAGVVGSGDALSSAIAAHLALGRGVDDACTLANTYVADLAVHAVSPGRGGKTIR
jgi:hydroxymethylpyrimidine/phosphomethylpyrimidine kinase